MRALTVSLVAVAACAHTPDLPVRPDATPPAGSTTEIFAARDGTQLFARAWKPAAGADERGVVVIMHGLKDYSGRYAAFAARLTAAGYAVYAFDLRGHGRSAGPRVAPDDWQDYVTDLDAFLARVEQREPGVPIFLFGHSMGGAIAALAAERHQPRIAGLVLSGPALAIDAPPLLIALTRLTAMLLPRAPALALDNHDFSSDPAAAAVMDRDPLVSQPAGPARTAAGLVEGMREIWAGANALTMPLLALHGERDKLTAPSGSRALVARVPATDKTLRIYPGAYHDLLHEPGDTGPRVAGDIVAWLDAHTGGAAVAAPPLYNDALPGDLHGWTQAVELGAGATYGGAENGFAGNFAVNLARPAPVGWAGALTASYAAGGYKALSLRPLGVALRGRDGGGVGLSAGAALITGAHGAFSVGEWCEQPLGPVHVGESVEWARRITNSSDVGPLGADLMRLAITLRAGADHSYWPGARAGVGPTLSVGANVVGDVEGWFALLGLQMYGAD